jgi:hypothetical protein
MGIDIELPEQNIWICGKCGNENEIYLINCKKCGKEIEINNNNEEITDKNDIHEENNVYNSGKTIVERIIFFSVILIIAVIVGSIIRNKQNIKKSNSRQKEVVVNSEINIQTNTSIDSDNKKTQGKIQYTLSPSPIGLPVSNLPNGERIGLLDFCTEVLVTDEDKERVIIDGILGNWVYISSPFEGWVFNGYLADFGYFESVMAGNWYLEWECPIYLLDNYDTSNEIDLRNVNVRPYDFAEVLHLDVFGDFINSNLRDSGGAPVGDWSIKDGKLILEYINTHVGFAGENFLDEYKILQLEENILILQMDNKIIKLTKVNSDLMTKMFYSDIDYLENYFSNNQNDIFCYERSPLIYSMTIGRIDLMDFLIENNDDINYTDIFGKNAAHYAIEISQNNFGRKDILLELLKRLQSKGIDLNFYDIYGKTPFDYFRSDKGAINRYGSDLKIEIMEELGF